MREWLVYVAIMAALFLVFFRDRPLIGIFAGLLVSGPLYLGLGYLLAKFGYQRKSLRQLRTERREDPERRVSADEVTAGPRPKPPPTRRTGGGQPGRPGGAGRRRR